MGTNEEKPDVVRAERLAHRHSLGTAHYEVSIGFAKTCLVLSGGALATSITFVRDIIGEGPVVRPHLLAAAWASFVVSLVLLLVSYLLSEREVANQIDDIDQALADPSRELRKPTRNAAALNWWSAGAFVLGAALLVAFAFANL